jgi:hypothetical protein
MITEWPWIKPPFVGATLRLGSLVYRVTKVIDSTTVRVERVTSDYDGDDIPDGWAVD